MAYKLLPETPKPPSISKESIHRLPAQAIKGAAAAVPGIFGDIASLANEYVAGPITKAITGQETVPYEETPLGKILPTTAQHTRNLESGIPYLKPKNKLEKFVSDVTQDASSLLLPGGALTKAGLRGTRPLKGLLTSLGANAGGEFVGQFTGDEKKGAYTKMGLMFLLSSLNKPGAKQAVDDLYARKDALLPPDAMANTGKTVANTNRLKREILQGRGYEDLAASEKFVVDEADKVLRNMQGGQINVKTLESMKRSLNENLEKFVYEAAAKGSKKTARVKAALINGYIKDAMKDYGKANPEWWKLQQSADQAFGAMQQSNFVSNFIQKHVKQGGLAEGLLHLFGGAAETLGTGVIPYQATKILYRIAKSPELAKHYTRVLSSAAAENAPLMNRELRELDQKLKKEETRRPKYRLLD